MTAPDDFEGALRTRLADATALAPRFSGIDLARPSADTHPDISRAVSGRGPGRRVPRRWLVAAASAVVVIAAGGWWATGRDESTTSPGAASCANIVARGNVIYGADGDMKRVPRADQTLPGVSRPRCDDGGEPTSVNENRGAGDRSAHGSPGRRERVAAFTIAGVDPSVAFLADGQVFVRDDLDSLPGRLRPFEEPFPCSDAGTITGRMTGLSEAAAVTEDYHLAAPYTATFSATGGEGIDNGRYRSVTVDLLVTEATARGTDVALLEQALGHGRTLAVDVTCTGQRFAATALRLGS